MKTVIPEPVFLSAPKAANLCGVSRNTICCWIRDGKLPSYSTAGGKYLIRPVDLMGFMKKNNMFVPQGLIELAAEEEAVNAPKEKDKEEERKTRFEPAILVVDDEPNARTLAVRTLEKINVQILEAENGFEAMHQLTKHPEIALIILDLVMPGQDGVKTFSQIKEQNDSLPVIIVTAYPPEHSEEIFGEKEPDLILNKPYQPGHLLSAAEAFLADLGI